MKIFNSSILQFFNFILLLVVCSCDNVDQGERFIPIDSHREADVEYRRVLIEDFTGQQCPNCPNAADEIVRLQAAYGSDSIIAVGIHGGQLAFWGNAKNIGLRTSLGDEYNSYWNVDSWPKGIVNRSSQAVTPDLWFTLVNDAIQLVAPVHIDVEANIDGDEIKATAICSPLNDCSGRLQLWLTESNIIALQKMPDGTTNREYVHNHVLRAAINGTWGEEVSLSEGQEPIKVTHSIAIDPAWNPGNLTVVAFIYNDSGVLQVAEAHAVAATVPSASPTGK